MIPILVDSNVIIDILAEDTEWLSWSQAALERAADSGLTLINPIVYAEISARFASETEVDGLVTEIGLDKVHLPWAASFLAGRAHAAYRRRGGDRRSPLPDFFIGAHAHVCRYRVLTRDPRRYRSYFPKVELICPSLG